MDWRILLEPDIQAFISKNSDKDVTALALQKSPSQDWPYPLILNQIKARQKAAQKMPEFLEVPGFIFPQADIMEQASSSACARFKANQFQGESMVDMTGGCGVDAFFMARNFKQFDIFERDPVAAAILAHNAVRLMGHGFMNASVTVHQGEAETLIQNVRQADLIYIDPQRREKNRKGIFDLESCSPDVVALMPKLMQIASQILIKTSPILDIHKGLEVLKDVCEVHVIGWEGDCKEVLYFIDKKRKIKTDDVQIKAIEIGGNGDNLRVFEFRNDDERNQGVDYAMPRKFIYEPGPAFMKAGGFKSMAQAYGLSKLHPHTHVYTSDQKIEAFPGRIYELEDILQANQKAFPFTHAEISVRNYPAKTEELRKKWKLKDGGIHRLIAVTLCDETRRILICRKTA